MVLSVVGCANGAKDTTKKEDKSTTEAKKDDSASQTKATANTTDKTSSPDKTSSTGSSIFTVTKESENTDIKYEKGKYKEVDEAVSIVKDYYLNGIEAVSSKIVSVDYDDSKDDANKWSTLPLKDKEKKDLDLAYQSFKNQIPEKIKDISIDNYTWEKVVGGDPKYAINVTVNLIIKTDKGDTFSGHCYTTVLNKNGDIKVNFK